MSHDTKPPAGRKQLTDAQRELIARRLRGEGAVRPGIPVRPNGVAVPLSFQQERIWVQEQLAPGTAAQNIPYACRIDGPLDPALLQRALDAVVSRHAGLRTVFALVDEVPRQQVLDSVTLPIDCLDLRSEAAAQRAQRARSLLDEVAARPFGDLSHGPLLRARLVACADDEHYFTLVVHHILADGWSMGLFGAELKSCYLAYATGTEPALTPLSIQYPDYAHWQRAALTGEAAQAQADYWRTSLAGAPQRLEFPTDRPRSSKPGHRGASVQRHFPAAGLAALYQLAEQEHASAFMATMAVFQLLVGLHTGEEDFLIGVPFAGRRHPETERLIGCFINPVAVRADLAGATTFRDLLRAVRSRALALLERQDYPFARVVESVCQERGSDTPLFQLMFAWQNAPRALAGASGLVWTPLLADSGSTQLDLTLLMDEMADGVRATLVFRTDLFCAASCERLLERFAFLLDWVSRHPDLRLDNACLLPPAERDWLLRQAVGAPTGREPAVETVVELFYRQAGRSPEAPALLGADGPLSYRQLEARVQSFAAYLRGRGVQPESRVALALGRGEAVAVAMLGVMTLGAACVLLDPDSPAARLETLLRDSGAELLLVDRVFATASAAALAVGIALIEQDDWRAAALPGQPVPVLARPQSLAYVIYTSGSTGMPKGVMVEQASLANQLKWRLDACGLGQGDAVLHTIPFYFDPSLWQLFGPLLAGASVAIASDGDCRDPARLARLIADHAITVVDFVPSMLAAFLASTEADALAGVRILFCGGEALGVPLLESVRARTQAVVFNQYGPTETAIDATSWRSDRDAVHGTVPIGRPIAGKRVYLCDRRLRLVPPGVLGEICIGGVGVARGYLDDPARTAQCFLPDPHSDHPGARLYRTGDLGRVLPDGQIEYAGRLDGQLKLRGYRIEPGEIAAQLNSHPEVRAAGVVVSHESATLTAHVALYPAATVTVQQLLDLLEARLPRYMVPSALFIHAELPTTANGKLDEKRLARLATEAAPRRDGTGNAFEQAVEAIWFKTLGVAALGPDDDFFMLGGNSLQAIHVVAHLKQQFSLDLSVGVLFEHPTVRRLADYLLRREQQALCVPQLRAQPDLDPTQPLSWRQRWMWRWVQDALLPELQQSLTLRRLHGPFDPELLSRAVDLTVERHEALRTRFGGGRDTAVQTVLAPRPGQLERVRLDSLAGFDLDGWCQRQFRRPIDLAAGQPFRAILLEAGPDEAVFYLSLHKLIDDGASAAQVLADLARIYESLRSGSPLPPQPLQQKDFVAWERAYLDQGRAGQMLEQCLGGLAGAQPLVLGARVTDTATERRRFGLDSATFASIVALSRRSGVTPFIVLMAAWQLTLARLSRQRHFLVGTPLKCRDEPLLQGMVARTVNMAVLAADLRKGPSFADLLQSVRQTMAVAHQLRHLPYALLIDRLTQQFATPPVGAVFNYLQSVRQAAPVEAGLTMTPLSSSIARPAENDLYLVASEQPDGVACTLFVRLGLLDADRVVALFVDTLRQGLAEPEMALGLEIDEEVTV
ncbi:amino acid adenylation domain-containing protein [Chitinimonas lacunae]|uniref:Amino acid adenylation domain-containing protein n=1 Tax=Chitinimonas lacunae TaxID=1963018 RepID=A0ABV8MPM4_9NEIS